MQNHLKKPEKVILWGFNVFTRNYILLLKKTNIEVLFIIDSFTKVANYDNVAIVSPDTYLIFREAYQNIPIIITAKNIRGEDSFIKIHDIVKNKMNLKNIILHPYFLRKYLIFQLFYRLNIKKVKKIIIYGELNNLTKKYIYLLKNTNLRIKFIISDINEKTYENIPIVSREKFIINKSNYSQIPIICTLDTREKYKTYITSYKNSHNIENPIFHPYFLRRIMPFQLFFSKSNHIHTIKRIVLYCNLNEDSKLFIELLKKSKIKISCIICEDPSMYNYQGIDIYEINLFLKKENILLIPICIYKKSKKEFDSAFDLFNNKLKILNRLLHPYFIVDYYKFNVNKNIIVNLSTGGNGNFLFDAILNWLLNKDKSKIYNFSESSNENNLLYNLSKDYQDQVDGETPSDFFYFKNKETANSLIPALHKERFKPPLHISHHIHYENVYNTAYFINRNYKIFIAFRHPYNIIISRFTAHLGFAQGEVSDYAIQASFKRLRYDLNYFKLCAEWVYNRIISLINTDLPYFRFEDLRNNPIDCIKKIAKYLNLSIPNTNDINIFWESIDGKKFYNGGPSQIGFKDRLEPRWKDTFTNQHMNILKEIGYEIILEKLGYDIDFESTISNSDYGNQVKIFKEKLSHPILKKKIEFVDPTPLSLNLNKG